MALRARACIPSVRSAEYRPQHEDADSYGPVRPSSAQLGTPRPRSAPLPSAPLPRPTHLGSGRLRSTNAESRMRAAAARCKAIRVGYPSARTSAALCVWRPRSPGLPRPPGAAPSFSRGLPREGEGRPRGRGFEGRGEEASGAGSGNMAEQIPGGIKSVKFLFTW